jgi:uncharacterized protein YlaI
MIGLKVLVAKDSIAVLLGETTPTTTTNGPPLYDLLCNNCHARIESQVTEKYVAQMLLSLVLNPPYHPLICFKCEEYVVYKDGAKFGQNVKMAGPTVRRDVLLDAADNDELPDYIYPSAYLR